MKKILLTLSLIILAQSVQAKDVDYMEIYRNLQPADFSYIHGIDPGNYYENQNHTWSPYPLFRLNSFLYFKNMPIEPGYYLLTPREYKDNQYILFKEAGKVKYIVPVYKREMVPEFFYEENLPKAKLSFGQRLELNTLNLIGKVWKRSKRKPIPPTYLEVTDLDNNFVSIIIYYDKYRYYTIFRTVRM